MALQWFQEVAQTVSATMLVPRIVIRCFMKICIS